MFIWFGVGLVCLIAGAEALVRGASRLATIIGISSLVIGLSVVAYGTSAPEAAVSVYSTFQGQTDLALGNVEMDIQRMVMPRDPTGDALHLALASYHKCDFLLTWNVQHLANANKFAHIRRVNALLGLFTPALVTPLELLA